MSQAHKRPDDMKRKLRELKQLEMRVRFPENSLHNINMKTSKKPKDFELIWDKFLI